MLRFLPLLLTLSARLNLRHVKLLALASSLALVTLTSGVGYLAWGWRGALLLPLVGGLVSVLVLHLVVRIAVSYGMQAHARGQHGVAVRVLWLTQLPFLRLYDRRGKVSQAFQESKASVGRELFSRLVGQQLAGFEIINP